MSKSTTTLKITALAIAALAAAGSASAQEAAAPSPFADFAEKCMNEGPRYDRTAALAKESGWGALSQDMTLGILPLDEPTAFDGWITQTGGDKPFEAIVIAKATVGEKPVESCTMAFAGVDAAQFERDLIAAKSATASGQQNGEVRVRKFFSIEREGFKEAVTLDLPTYPNGADEVVASVVAEQQIEN
ncbi:hypothetical protein [Rhizobium sp. BG4]|uniref:hypothetical protein n=1 Tax=Rhizobium sp. BG4 TaxID=2613770 RepID=UPI00193E17CE|nr:hypothetical protein [Rhizobium sp. BG4]QRM46995.1 hypothetical protein F2982_27150 [Rhizobium sp. BG4]